MSADLAAQLAEMVRAFILASDDALRADNALWADMSRVTRSALLIPQGRSENGPQNDLSGLDEGQLAEMSAFNAHMDVKAAVAMAGRNLTAVLPLVKAQAAGLLRKWLIAHLNGIEACLRLEDACRSVM